MYKRILMFICCITAFSLYATGVELSGEYTARVVGHHRSPQEGEPIILSIDPSDSDCYLLSVFSEGRMKVIALSCVDKELDKPLDIDLPVTIPIEHGKEFLVDL